MIEYKLQYLEQSSGRWATYFTYKSNAYSLEEVIEHAKQWCDKKKTDVRIVIESPIVIYSLSGD